jgi:SAM-dependent methyltransferase
VTRCAVCGSDDLFYAEELSAALVREWELSADEAVYVNRQQGLQCRRCGSTLRCMTLATALMRHLNWKLSWKSSWKLSGKLSGEPGAAGTPDTFEAMSQLPAVRELSVLEINEAGGVTRFLAQWPGHVFARYPEVDMQELPYPDESFDLVVHSDTLEHVPEPVRGLEECRRVLRDGGACVYTVPIIVGRLTRSRSGLPPSYHGDPANGEGYLVHTEFGADAWTWPLAAGFSDCRIVSLEHPAAHALVAVR